MNSCCLILAAVLFVAADGAAQNASARFHGGRFSWKASGPLIDIGPGRDAPDPHVSIKDPTFVFHGGRWHLFTTVRLKSGKVDIEYLSFADWAQTGQAQRHVLALHDQYYCAPQVFYFTPHRKWYLVYQLAEKTRKPPFGPCFSTTENLADPKSWTRPQPMVADAPEKPKWLDFWVICDREKAHLFYTSLDGHMWRRETKKSDFPFGWSEQELALKADIFEASHTYKLKGRSQYLTVVEAQGGGRRYYKAYLADRLEGPWKGSADTLDKPFAAHSNVEQDTEWTTNISHGELIRSGVDESMELDPANLRFVFQGASDKEYRGQGYGGIPWRLGILEMRR
ncbi:MAG: glycoside hydrolase [Verrucomicrobia bacterium]|nr:glycoside hydrolase [Verrucomicrobiota bacterium]